MASFPTSLSQKAAEQVVLQYLRENNQANSALSVSLQDEDEEGISARMDNANYHLLSLEGETTAGTGPLPRADQITTYVTDATRPPAEFLAVIKMPAVTHPQPEPAYTSLFLFRKDSRSKPWRVLYEQQFSAKAKIPMPTLHGGHADIQSRLSTTAITAYARYLSRGVGNLATGTYTSTAYRGQERAIAKAAGDSVVEAFAYRTDPSPVTSISVRGGTLEFAGVDEVDTATPAAGGCGIAATAGDSAAYRALVPTGTDYAKIVLNSVGQATLLIPAGKHPRIHVLDAYFQWMSALTPVASNCSAAEPTPSGTSQALARSVALAPARQH
ncbi:MAG: hypothetical protein WA751_11880 [Candidatus Dormiibacterota bacterium]